MKRQDICYLDVKYFLHFKEELHTIISKFHINYFLDDRLSRYESVQYLSVYFLDDILTVYSLNEHRYLRYLEIDKEEKLIVPTIKMEEFEIFMIEKRGQIAMQNLNLI